MSSSPLNCYVLERLSDEHISKKVDNEQAGKEADPLRQRGAQHRARISLTSVLPVTRFSNNSSSRCTGPRRRTIGTGTTWVLSRRPGNFFPVGWPSSSNSKCHCGLSYGELMMGLSVNAIPSPSKSVQLSVSPAIANVSTLIARRHSARIEPLLSTVMRGLDPRIHLLAKRMDCRVKPGNDNRFNMTGNRCSPPISN
jgi:hypothetical protein